MRYFLTGATGFLGGALARHLVARGHTVRALVRTRAAAPPDLHTPALPGIVEQYVGDVTDRESMRAPMTGVDGVFHVAGWYKIGLRERDRAIAVNIDGTRNVLELMRELQIARGVYTSTLAVNSDTHGQIVDETYRFTGTHISVYDATKAEAHRVAERFIADGLPLVIVQPGGIYGPGDTSSLRALWLRYLQRQLPVVPARSAFCWAHVDDEASGHLLAMERGQAGRNYFLAGPAHTLVDALAIAEQIAGIPAPRMHVPRGVMQGMSRVVGLFDRWVPLPPEYTSEGLRVAGGVTYLGTNARAVKELGWSVRPLRDGLTETLRHEMRLLAMSPRT